MRTARPATRGNTMTNEQISASRDYNLAVMWQRDRQRGHLRPSDRVEWIEVYVDLHSWYDSQKRKARTFKK